MDCGACVSSASCPDKITPDGKRLKPKGCTSNCLVPTREETTLASPHGAGWENGKVFSCACGGDARTDPFCAYQQDTTFLFHVTAAAEDDDRSRSRSRSRTRLFGGASPSSSGSAAAPANLNMHVREYGGIPDTGRPDVPDWKYRYAYAPVWDANFTGCRWRVSECLEPLPASEDCVIYECPGGEVACPPTDVPECPGRNALGCGDGPNGTSAGKYWQHPCNPLVTPQSKGVTFWCPLEPATSDASDASADGGGSGGRSAGGGAHLCYWTQPGVIPSFAVTCSVGNCLYEETDAGGLSQLCPADFTPAEFWTGDLVTRVAMFCVAAALVLAAALYVRVESQSLYSRKEDLLLLENDAGVPSSAGPRHPGHPRHPHVRTPSTVLDPAGPGPVGERRRRGEFIGDAGGSPAGSSRRGSSPPRGMVISWEDVRAYATIVTPYGGTRTKRILRGVSGYAGGAGYAGESAASGGGCSSVHRGGAGLFAILGPSGAGKSTLLDILAGRPGRGRATRGVVSVNGESATAARMRAVSGYVPQDDVLPGTSTVWEHLLFNAALRMPAGTSNETIRRCAVGWMRELGLVKVAHSRIGDAFTRGLSGGEKRRVSIATELLTSPGLMFLDEPTTGLDSTNAAKVVDILSGLGKMGVTVVLSIHQPRPDIFRLLDRVMVMSGEGRVVYTGPSADAEAHFASLEYVGAARSVRVADFVLDAVLRGSDEDVARMVADFEGSAIHAANEAFAAALRSAAEVKEEERRAEARTSRGRGNAMRAMRDGRTDDAYTPRGDDSDPDRIARADLETSDLAFIDDDAWSASAGRLAPFGKQCRMLCGRLLRNLARHPFLLTAHFAAAFATALGVGLMFFRVGSDQGGIQNRMGALFFILLYLTLMSLSSLPVWREDRLLFLRERAAGAYGTHAYFAAVAAFEIVVLRVVPPIFFTVFAYPMIGLHGFGRADAGAEASVGPWEDDPGGFMVPGMAALWRLARFTTTLVLANVAAAALCMCVGIVTPSNAVANLCGLGALLLSVLGGGFLLNEQGGEHGGGSSSGSRAAFADLVARLSFVHHAFDALLINEFLDGGTFEFTPKWTDASGKTRDQISVDVSGAEVLEFFSFGHSEAALATDLAALASLTAGYVVLAFLLLKVTARRLGVE